jgi:hypothetical protein
MMNPSGAGDLGREILEAQRRFDVVLLTGERWSCELVRWGENELLVATEAGRYLLPKHTIAYVVLEEVEESLLAAETAAVVATDSTAVATSIGGEDGEIVAPVP